MKKVLLVVGMLAVLSAVSFGGWEHLNGRTYWTASPTAATIWLRDNDTGDLHLSLTPQIYDNTIKLSDTNSVGIFVPSYGLYTVDEAGDYHLIDDVCQQDHYLDIVGWRVDVECEVNTNLDVVAKE
jgi:hypothetical protein